MKPNGLANLRQVSGAKVAVASFVTDAARRQAQRYVRWHLAEPIRTATICANEKAYNPYRPAKADNRETS